MKKLYLDNKIEISKKIRNRKATKVALIVILVLTLAMATGCGKKKNKTPTPTTPSATVTKEETTPEVTKPTESTPVETVESTETVPETEDVESIDLSKYTSIFECIEDLKNYDTLMIIVYADEGKEILLDGDSYTYDKANNLFLNCDPKDNKIKDAYMKSSNESVSDIMHTDDFYYLALDGYFSDGLYTIVVVYNDDTEQELTINFSAK